MVATVVDTHGAAGDGRIASLIAGVGVTFVFSLAILGAARFADLSRTSGPIAASVRGRARGRWRSPRSSRRS